MYNPTKRKMQETKTERMQQAKHFLCILDTDWEQQSTERYFSTESKSPWVYLR